MKTLTELRAFCEGYRQALANDRAFYSNTLAGCDDWVVWGGYDINFAGADYSGHAKHDNDLHVDAYKAGWTDSIGEPLYSFTIFTTEGELEALTDANFHTLRERLETEANDYFAQEH